MSLNSNNAYFDFVTREEHVPGFLTVPFQLAFPPDSNPTKLPAPVDLWSREQHTTTEHFGREGRSTDAVASSPGPQLSSSETSRATSQR